MPLQHELLEVAQEERQQQVADVHAVDVRVRRDHDAVVPEPFDAVLDPERPHDVVELFVLVDGIALQAVAVERLALKRVDRLGIDVARRHHHARRGVALGQEERRIFASLRLGVVIVELAVRELRDPDRNLLGALARVLLDRREFLPDAFVERDLLEQHLRLALVLMQPANDLSFTAGTSQPRTSVEPSLFFVWLSKTGILELDRNGGHDAVADVFAGEALLGELVDALEQPLAEGALVGAAIVRVLAVHEAK